jgi:U4/U6.U5 tri-snRNP-associated protein 1
MVPGCRSSDENFVPTKQAYRELSYRFHGRMPSQKSRDRRQRQKERRTAQLKAGSSDTPLGAAAALHRTQEALGQAHITLSRK